MDITPEKCIRACKTGVDLLSSRNVPVPAASMEDALTLRAILVGVLSGQLEIRAAKAHKPARKSAKK